MTIETDPIIEKRLSSRLTLFVLLAFVLSLMSPPAWSQLVPGSMGVRWSEGSANCAKDPQPPLQEHPYNTRTFILRENLCTTFEAPFMYLLIGSTKALLIDTGDIADPTRGSAGDDSDASASRRRHLQNFHCLSFIPIGTLIIAPVMDSSRIFPMLRWLDLISTAFGASTTSRIGPTVSLRSISAIERSM